MNNSPRGRGTDKVQSSPELAHLSLPALRAYRQHLIDEEERISYWRRLTATRLDALGGAAAPDRLTRADITRALGQTGTGERRRALAAVHPSIPLPTLPGLDQPWTQAAAPDNLRAVQESLQVAVATLTDYRSGLQQRLSAATSELITRYMAEPHAAFDLLEDRD